MQNLILDKKKYKKLLKFSNKVADHVDMGWGCFSEPMRLALSGVFRSTFVNHLFKKDGAIEFVRHDMTNELLVNFWIKGISGNFTVSCLKSSETLAYEVNYEHFLAQEGFNAFEKIIAICTNL